MDQQTRDQQNKKADYNEYVDWLAKYEKFIERWMKF